MKTLSPRPPASFTRRTRARAESGVSASTMTYGMIVGAAMRLSAESFACAMVVSIPSPLPGSRTVVIP